MKAAAEAGTVKRVVITSSIAAVYDSSIPVPKEKEESKLFDETSWTDLENASIDIYAKSKTLAEKAAWDFVKELSDDKKFELVAINPGMVIGPLLTKRFTTSHAVVKKLLDKSTPAVAKLNCNITDVRDVAQAHLQALVLPEVAGQRHLIVSHSVWVKEVAMILQKEFSPQGYFVPTFTAPNALVRVSSFIDKGVKLVVPRLGKECKYDNKRMQEVLKITPIDLEKTVIDTANSMIEMGVIKRSKKSLKPKKENAPQEEGKFLMLFMSFTRLILSPSVFIAAKTNGTEEPKEEAVKKTEELEPEDKAVKTEAPAVSVEVAAN